MRHQLFFPVRIAQFFCLLMMVAAAFLSLPALASDSWLHLPGGSASFVQEPVFNDRVFVYEVGKEHKFTVVLVHGLGNGGARDWEHLIPVLAKRFHVITFDLPGFGRSDKGNNLYSPATYTEFLHFITQKLVGRQFFLVGHSMGGAIAARYTATYPEDVARLVLVDAAGILHKVAFEKYLAGSAVDKQVPEVYETMASDVRSIINFFIDASEFVNIGPQLVLNTPPLRNTLLGGDPVKIAALSLVLEDFSAIIPRIKQQTLLIWGERDPVTPVRTGKVLDEILPTADLRIIPGVGHAPMREAVETFNKYVIDFLTGKLSVLDTHENKAQAGAKEAMLSCNEQSNLVVDGSYTTIEINDCKNITLRNVFADKLVVRNSIIDLENVVIDGRDQGINAVNSDVRITNGRISGDIAIYADESRFDIAGTKLVGRKLLAKGNLPSNFVFSLVYAESPGQKRFLHDFIQISTFKSL